MQLTVVIAAASGEGPARRCIRSLEAAGARGRCDVIVVTAAPLDPPDWVRQIVLGGEAGFPALRAAGLEAAATPRVAMLSEDYTVDSSWLSRSLAEAPADVVAGVTIPPPDASLAARAAWLWEYAHVAPPVPAGPLGAAAAMLTPGGNAVYRRESVSPDVLRTAGNELEYHRRLHSAGLVFERDAALVAVYHPPALGQFVRDRSRWSRTWAGARARTLPAWSRWTAAATRPLLPPVLLARFAARIAQRPRHWLSCVAALPLFAVFACAQAYGEAAAYLHDG